MKAKKTIPPSASKRISRGRSGWLRWALIVTLSLVGILLLWFVLRFEAFNYGKKEILRPEFQMIMERIKLPGAAVYSAIADKGCDTSSSVGLATRINCDLEGFKLYRSKTISKVDLRPADRYLISTGWQRRPSKMQSENTFIESLYSEADRNPGVTYERDGLVINIMPILYEKSVQGSAYGLFKLAAPTTEEHVIGVSLQSTYWRCHEESIFNFPCPPAPSKLE